MNHKFSFCACVALCDGDGFARDPQIPIHFVWGVVGVLVGRVRREMKDLTEVVGLEVDGTQCVHLTAKPFGTVVDDFGG